MTNSLPLLSANPELGITRESSFNLTVRINNRFNDTLIGNISWGRGMPIYALTPAELAQAQSDSGLVLTSPPYDRPGAFRPTVIIGDVEEAADIPFLVSAGVDLMVSMIQLSYA